MAKKMLQRGDAVKEVAELTELPIEMIEEFKENL